MSRSQIRCLAIALAALLCCVAPACAQHLRPEGLAAMKVSPPSHAEAYGPDPLEFGQLRLPKSRGPFPLVVIIHGGCWTKGFADLSYMSPLAADLTAKGAATWNLEYRQLGDSGGGWPGTFQDWAAATDHVRILAKTYPLDLTRVVVIGHSAGAHAALWLAARPRLPADSPIRGQHPLPIKATVPIDGPGDITAFIGPDQRICGAPVIANLMGGLPSQVPARYAQGNPIELLPSHVPSALVSSVVLPSEDAEAYRKAATARGDSVQVLRVENAGHFDMLSPATPSGAATEALILKAAGLPTR
jgi:acetyl esterase/lipase